LSLNLSQNCYKNIRTLWIWPKISNYYWWSKPSDQKIMVHMNLSWEKKFTPSLFNVNRSLVMFATNFFD